MPDEQEGRFFLIQRPLPSFTLEPVDVSVMPHVALDYNDLTPYRSKRTILDRNFVMPLEQRSAPSAHARKGSRP